jgi:NTP pyrophosphatase (non-canonical NTP hydrolase)
VIAKYGPLLPRDQPSFFDDGDAPLGLDEYQHFASLTDRNERHGAAGLGFVLLGLFGEAGSLLSVVKKKQRDKASYLGYAPHVIEELGDVLWYFSVIAARGGLALSDVGHNLYRGYADWQDGGGANLRFRDLQSSPTFSSKRDEPTPAFEKTLLDLAADIGTLLADHQAGRLADNQAALKGALVTVLRTLVKAADEAGVTLDEAAAANLHKIFDRWPAKRVYPEPLDKTAPEYEQLPRQMTIDVFERTVAGKTYVFQQSNGINIGDRLTDNAVEPDDYRFHDVFHYAYCSVLTWSPVVRSFLRLKRKTDPVVDEVQDGARAILIEEGVATWIFGQARRLDFLADVKPGDLSFDILKTVRQFVSGYEPEQCPLWLWEEAILQGFEAFRFLRRERRARLLLDMERRRLHVGELPK